ncbi:MAG: phosphoadenylyl-sulfate reductase [Actinomycetota bacterium]|nr:phosphoadenylyl-sulfate reductase [Actinomycetota bacterium]
MASPALVDIGPAHLAEVSRSFEGRPASSVIRWAVELFHPRLCLTASMNDAVLIDLAVKVEPSIEVVFIDTGHHFPETLETLELVRSRYGLNLTVVSPEAGAAALGPDGCCSVSKVALLERGLAGHQAWMSGLRRAEAPTRATAPIVGVDLRGLVKVNPIATWTDEDVAGYIADNDIPVNPLLYQGYPSVGCQPCTFPVAQGADPRSGRWAGSERTECGLHV